MKNTVFRSVCGSCVGLWLTLVLIGAGCHASPNAAITPTLPQATPTGNGIVTLTALPAITSSPVTSVPTAAPTGTPQPFIGNAGALPEQARMRLGIGAIGDVALSPDGAQVAVGTRTGLYVYRIDGFQPVWRKYTDSAIDRVIWSPDSTRLLTGTWKDSSTLWDAQTGDKIRSVGQIGTDVLSPDGTMIATATWINYNPTTKEVLPAGVVIYDGHTGKVSQQFTIDDPDVWATVPSALAWSSDGQRLAVSAGDSLIVWNIKTNLSLWKTSAPPDVFSESAFSPDSRWMALTGTDNGLVTIIDSNTGAEVAKISETEVSQTPGIERPHDTQWSPDKKWLAILSIGRVEVVDTTLWKIVLTKPSDASSIVWSGDSSQLAVTDDDAVTVLSLPSGDIGARMSLDMQTEPVGLPKAMWVADSGRLLTATQKNLVVWDASNQQVVSGLSATMSIDHLGWTPDSNALVLSGDAGYQFWDISNETQLKEPPADLPLAVQLSRYSFTSRLYRDELTLGSVSDGNALAVESVSRGGCGDGPFGGGCFFEQGALTIKDAATNHIVFQRTFKGTGITSFAWSPDKRILAVGLGNGIDPQSSHGIDENRIVLINAASGQQTGELVGHSGNVTDLAWSSNGLWLASMSADGTVIVWNIAS